jgi:hypothetical protein
MPTRASPCRYQYHSPGAAPFLKEVGALPPMLRYVMRARENPSIELARMRTWTVSLSFQGEEVCHTERKVVSFSKAKGLI